MYIVDVYFYYLAVHAFEGSFEIDHNMVQFSHDPPHVIFWLHVHHNVISLVTLTDSFLLR